MTEIPQTEQGMQAMQDAQELQGRQAGGRFGPGNRYGKGRPPRAIEASYMAALADIVPPERWAAICDKAAQDAEAGDCLLYTSPSPRDRTRSRMPSSA